MVDVVCLQGGAEFTAACVPMDRAVLSLVGPGPVVVLPSAAGQGREYDRAGANAVAYYRELGADVSVATDPREDVGAALEALGSAALVVLPGGSPDRLVDALVGTPLGAALAGVPAVSGASAGAMVLCSTTVLPDIAEHPLVPGCGIVTGTLVVPHYAGSFRWIDLDHHVPSGVRTFLGLPECSGVIITEGRFLAAGARATTVHQDGERRIVRVGESWPAPP